MTGTAEESAERLVRSSLGLIDVLAANLGDRLGWYRALATEGPCTAEELVAGGTARYATGWLEQQATGGVLTVDPDGRFRLPAGAAEVLTDPDSPNYSPPRPHGRRRRDLAARPADRIPHRRRSQLGRLRRRHAPGPRSTRPGPTARRPASRTRWSSAPRTRAI